MRSKIPLILLLCLLYLCPLPGQSGAEHTLRVKGYQYKNSPITSQVLSITRSTDGYMWIGSELGLLRYDGHAFKAIRYSPADSNSLRGNYVSQITVDNYNRLWLINSGNLSVYDIDKDHFTHIKHETYRARIHSDPENDRLIICAEGKLYINQGKEIAPREMIIEELREDSTYFTFAEAIDKDKLILGSSDKIYLYSFEKGLLKTYDGHNYKTLRKSNNLFYCSYYDRNENAVYIGSWGRGVFKIDLSEDEVKQYGIPKSIFQTNVVQKIIPADNYAPGKVWLCTAEGLILFDKTSGEFNRVEIIQDFSQWPDTKFTFTVFNTESKIWFGRMDGLYSFEPYENMFKFIPFEMISSREAILKIDYDQKDSLCENFWILFQRDIRKYNFSDGRKEPSIPVLKDKLSQMVGLLDFLVYDKVLYVLSFKTGLAIYDLKAGKLIELEDNLSDQSLTKIERSVDGKIYVFGYDNLYSYDMGNRSFVQDSLVSKYLEARPDYFLHDIESRSADELWLVLRNHKSLDFELIRYNINQQMFQIHGKKDEMGFQALEIAERIAFYGKDGLVLTGLNGFCDIKIEESAISIVNFNEEYDKIVGGTKRVYTDENDDCWIETVSGIYKYNTDYKVLSFFPATSEDYNLTRLHILLSPNCDEIVLHDRKRLISSAKANFISNPPQQVYLSDIAIIEYEDFSVQDLKSPLILKHYQNSLKLNFSILEFVKSDRFQYQYRIVKDGKWQEIVGNELKFEHIGPGNYNLEVRCINDKGLISMQNFNLAFVIKQAWYKSWWFSLLIILLVAAILYFFFRLRHLQKQKMERVRFGIAQDLHDDIGSYLSQIRLLSELEFKKTKDSRMEMIARKLNGAMKSMQDVIWNINPANDSLIDVIYKIQEFAIECLEPLDIDLNFDIEDRGQGRKLDIALRRHIYLIFKEAINNAAKYSQADEVKFTYRQDKGYAILSLVDNGVGYKPDEVKYGNGIKNMQNRAEQVGATIRITTSESGTEIELRIY